MNRLATLLAIASTLLLLAAGSASAFPVSAGDTIYFDKSYGSTGGGQFDVSLDDTTDYLFSTFCLEKNEYLNLQNGFRVSGISSSAQSGGIGGGENGKDPLSESTKWLYWHFATGDLNTKVSEFKYNTDNGADSLQRAFWYLEEEITGFSDTVTDALIAAAKTALAGGNFTEGQVAVINLVNMQNGCAQDQLIAAPVPEPTTLLLFGSGLAGIVLLHRRRKK